MHVSNGTSSEYVHELFWTPYTRSSLHYPLGDVRRIPLLRTSVKNPYWSVIREGSYLLSQQIFRIKAHTSRRSSFQGLQRTMYKASSHGEVGACRTFETAVNFTQAVAAPAMGLRILPESLRGLQGNDGGRGSSLGGLERRPGCVPFRISPLRPTRHPQHRLGAPRRPLAPGAPAPRQTPRTQGHRCLPAPRG